LVNVDFLEGLAASIFTVAEEANLKAVHKNQRYEGFLTGRHGVTFPEAISLRGHTDTAEVCGVKWRFYRLLEMSVRAAAKLANNGRHFSLLPSPLPLNDVS
jgi:hypothetical protein